MNIYVYVIKDRRAPFRFNHLNEISVIATNNVFINLIKQFAIITCNN